MVISMGKNTLKNFEQNTSSDKTPAIILREGCFFFDSWCSVDRDGSVLRRWWVYGYIRQRGDGSPVHIATINRGVDEFFFRPAFVCIHGNLMDRGWRGDQPREGCCFHGSLTLEDIYFYVPKNSTRSCSFQLLRDCDLVSTKSRRFPIGSNVNRFCWLTWEQSL